MNDPLNAGRGRQPPGRGVLNLVSRPVGVLVGVLLVLAFVAGVLAGAWVIGEKTDRSAQTVADAAAVAGSIGSPDKARSRSVVGQKVEPAPQDATVTAAARVPHVTGQTRELAEARVLEAGLQPQITGGAPGSRDAVIDSQEPRGGATVAPGSAVRLTVEGDAPARADGDAAPSLATGHSSMSVLSSASEAGKVVALTIDLGDTVTRQSVSEILDELASRDVTCTFFVTGWFIRNHPELVGRIAASGHDLGNHTDDHPDCTQISRERFRQELQAVESLLGERGLSISRPQYYRPPFGEYNSMTTEVAAGMGYRTVMWSATSKDWDAATDPGKATRDVLAAVGPGGVILTHATTVSQVMIPRVLDELDRRGYRVTSLNGLIAAAQRERRR